MNVKRWIALQAGAVAERCFPGLARQVAAGDPLAAEGRLGRLILKARLHQAARAGAWDELRRNFTGYWTRGEGDRFYDAYTQRFDQWFLGTHYPAVEALCQMAAAGPFRSLVEIGCGDGRVLSHMAGRLPGLERLIGLDLNPGIIHRNRATYAGQPRLSFESTDALGWLLQHAEPGTIVMTYGGVLEYFTQEDLVRLYGHLAARCAPAAVALVEPLADDFDGRQETASRPHGAEYAFSHPYRRLLEDAGFTVAFEQEVRLDHRWLMLAARTPPQPRP